ncbi:PoNi-like cognate immunity protein [Ralstonia sp. CHL-2022]|uniref:PoNi-like cognate immunity protein n=1 Tax=Ralstonia mojiangensis TaxID=2953895 RepID=A0ABT2L7P4_9RALS|nr:PoNi-like cognate immunity protein [Ralstonia mojiangensis]MCT7298910.1 PoNi-like cognate immunity protein [Ralstonia mojiangensis]MCT7311435.1 PoNi-like cognate immunity protein [Ralstonia mojiangensis]
MNDFSTRRRQRFISEQYFKWLAGFSVDSIEKWSKLLPANGSEDSKRAIAASLRAENRFELLLLRYTAGEPIAPMREELDKVIADYEEYAKYQSKEFESPNWPAFRLSELNEYERAMQLIGLCYLLHRRDLLPRIAALEDPTYRAQDTLYEDLLAYGMDGRVDVDQWFHESYRDCINSIYGDSDEESLADLNTYLDKWYASMRGVNWHDSHLDLSEERGLYFGYWAIEAAALAYLLELDDTLLREHIVYPKDLVDFARSFQGGDGVGGEGANRLSLRCEAGQPCPKTGYWMTPAQPGSRRHFQQGAVMPEVHSDYGSTIWQWDNGQSDPKL